MEPIATLRAQAAVSICGEDLVLAVSLPVHYQNPGRNCGVVGDTADSLAQAGAMEGILWATRWCSGLSLAYLFSS